MYSFHDLRRDCTTAPHPVATGLACFVPCRRALFLRPAANDLRRESGTPILVANQDGVQGFGCGGLSAGS